MTALREAAQQALAYMDSVGEQDMYPEEWAVAKALRAALAQEEQPKPARAQQMRDAGHTRRPTLREMGEQEREDIAQNLQSRLDAALLLEERRQEIAQPRRETEQEQAMRDLLTTGTGVLLGGERIDPASMYKQQEQGPVAWTDRELELIDGMIEVQLHHAAQCDGIANRTMAEKQKSWDMERVALLHKIKSSPPRREPEQEPVAYTTGLIWRPRQSELVLKVTRSKQERYGFTVPLWTSPPRREWRGLTMQEINALPEVGGRMWNMGSAVSVLRAIRAVEAALKERNT